MQDCPTLIRFVTDCPRKYVRILKFHERQGNVSGIDFRRGGGGPTFRPTLTRKKMTREKANPQNHNSWEGSW